MAQDTSSPTAGALATRREWVGLAVLALPTLLLALDISVLYLALPQLSADLDVSPTQQLWIVDIYGFFIAGFLITMGTLGDRIGRRRLLMIGATAFAAASVLAAYSSSAEMLIVTRAVLGIAGATLMPSTLALISNMFHDAHQRTVAISVWMTCFMGGMIVGPLVGGILLENFWWGSVFLLGVPVMVLLLVTAPLLLPEYRDEDAGRLDLVSVVLALAAILPVIYGLKELARDGWQLVPLVAIALGLTLGVVFVRRQLVLPSPLLDMQLFKHRTFSAALSIGLGGGIVMAGLFLLVTLYLQLVEGLSPLRAGLTLVPLNLAMAVATMLTPQLARWIRPAYIIGGGLVVAIVGLLVVTQQVADGSLTPIVVGFLLACVGIAAPSALGTGLVVGSAPPEKARFRGRHVGDERRVRHRPRRRHPRQRGDRGLPGPGGGAVRGDRLRGRDREREHQRRGHRGGGAAGAGRHRAPRQRAARVHQRAARGGAPGGGAVRRAGYGRLAHPATDPADAEDGTEGGGRDRRERRTDPGQRLTPSSEESTRC